MRPAVRSREGGHYQQLKHIWPLFFRQQTRPWGWPTPKGVMHARPHARDWLRNVGHALLQVHRWKRRNPQRRGQVAVGDRFFVAWHLSVQDALCKPVSIPLALVAAALHKEIFCRPV